VAGQQEAPGYNNTPQGNVTDSSLPPEDIWPPLNPLEALTWAEEETSSALSFHLDFGSLYVGQQPQKSMALAHTSTCLENC